MEIEVAGRRWWQLTDAEAERLNPPPDAAQRDEWLPLGFVPLPRTRVGWFLHHLVHGLWMRYPLHKVAGYAFANMAPRRVVIDLRPLLDEVGEEDEDRVSVLEAECERLMRLADPFAVPYWPPRTQWRAVGPDGTITYYYEMPEFRPWGWFADSGYIDGVMQLYGADWRNSLRARGE